MGETGTMEQACLLIGALCKDNAILNNYPEILAGFGKPAKVSPLFDFDFTQYYTPAMGTPLFRRFYIYPPGFDPETLAEVKLRTNALEKLAIREYALGVPRPLNLDPGYLTLSKLILASTKDHAHRIYLAKGIFAEITLFYRAKTYQAWPWTFPDFASQRYIPFLMDARKQLLS